MTFEQKTLGLIHAFDDETDTFYVEHRNGSFSRVDATLPDWLAHGDVVLFGEGTFEQVSAELWTESPIVATVRRKYDTYSILSTGGRLIKVPNRREVEYAEGNTVLAHELVGVTSIVDKKSLLDDATESTAPRNEPMKGNETFADFGGHPNIVQQAREFVDNALNRREELVSLGVEPPRGALFTGGPGTGKTKLARIIANEGGVPYFLVQGPEIHNKWVGESERIIREIFDAAEQEDKALIIFDEIDSAVGNRGAQSHEQTNRVVAQVLTKLDGLTESGNVVVVGTTNRAQDVDVALRRPGRLGLEIHFPLPSLEDRVHILLKSAPPGASSNLPVEHVAGQAEGWSAAELVDIWTQAMTIARSDSRYSLGIDDFLKGFNRGSALRSNRHASSAEK